MLARRSQARATATLSLIALVGLAATPAFADPAPPTPSRHDVEDARGAAQDTKDRVAALQRKVAAATERLDAVTDQAATASEEYNGARALLNQRTAAAKAADAAARTADAAAGDAKEDVDALATQAYISGTGTEGLDTLLGLARGTGDLARAAADADAVTGFRDRTLTDAREAAGKARATRRAAAVAQLQQKAAATKAQQAFTAATARAKAAEAEQNALEAEKADLVAQLAKLNHTTAALEQRRQDALETAAAKAAAESDTRRSTLEVETPKGLPTPNRSAAATAVAFAKAQLGEPYLWAAEGPNRWDCSGLTRGAWKAAGRDLTHYSIAQYKETKRVPLADLAPGDLVFFGDSPGTIHHVALYVGDGQMIEAPRAGKPVRYAPIQRRQLLPYGGRIG